jgi:hypothetical protein
MGSLKREPHTYNAVQHISQTSVGKSVLVDARLRSVQISLATYNARREHYHSTSYFVYREKLLRYTWLLSFNIHMNQVAFRLL